jgi:hypothetical protein
MALLFKLVEGIYTYLSLHTFKCAYVNTGVIRYSHTIRMQQAIDAGRETDIYRERQI